MWYSFPAASKGHTWTEATQRRISAECLVQHWRKDAGGCADCDEKLEGACLAECIRQLDDAALKAGWDLAFADRTVCADEPLPSVLSGSDKVTVWHIMEAGHSGLENKDSGDFLGDVDFIMHAIARDLPGNKEAKIYGNVIEQAEVQVVGWTDYQPCNVCDGTETDPCVDGYWCVGSSNFTQDTLPGKQHYGDKAMWYSFPAASSGLTWRETLQCLVQVWRADAGGCDECDEQQEGSCLHDCIGKLDTAALRTGWDRAFANATLCAEQPPPNVTVWHIMDAHYTGLGNKDSGDFLGDVDFIMHATARDMPGNTEAKVYGNVIEQAEVQVTGWTDYQPCNVCDGTETEPCIDGYCHHTGVWAAPTLQRRPCQASNTMALWPCGIPSPQPVKVKRGRQACSAASLRSVWWGCGERLLGAALSVRTSWRALVFPSASANWRRLL